MDEKNLAMHKVEVDNTAQNASSNSEETSSKHLSRDDSDHVSIDPKAEQKLIRKLDFVLLPLFTLIYACNFIDRTAIGNARIAGLEKDLDMHGFDFNIALTTFYISYIVSEIPSNLALKRFGSIWIAFLVISFGAVAIGSAFVKSFGSLLVTRVLLGFAEGGTLSGLVYILARYYRRHELVLRVGIFFGLSPSLAGAFGGLLASGLLSVSDIGDVQRWRKIFLIEGIITIGFGILLIFFMPADPTVTRLFNDEERELAIARLDADQVVKTGGRKEPTTWKLVLRSFNFNDIPLLSRLRTLTQGFGQLGSVIADMADKRTTSVWTYLPTDAPDFHKGNTLNLITSVISCVITALGGVYILWENRKRDRGERDGRLEGKSQHEIEQLGYLHPEFRYQL
ncbi:putative transporter [Psilocybe cubensis]|uniref:Transporter n=1 Tax=Psilocybe cubensis TaxID=181762 RepID=A0ACB8GUS2_PSICU|nr:putative transporter [Psilocybe cubensis]KAH9479326.1 putative transporter [Psilocybe cubensis]